MSVLLNKTIKVATISGTSDAYDFRLYVESGNQDIPGNRTPVVVRVYAKGNRASYSSFSKPTQYLYFDGSYKTETKVTTIDYSERLILEYSDTIEHNGDGTKSINISTNYVPNYTDSYLPRANTISENITLPTIPRASLIKTLNDFTADNNPNVGVPFNLEIIKYYSGFRNYLNISTMITGNSVFIAERDNFNGGQITLSSDELTRLYNASKDIPGNKYKLRFALTTYSGTTQIGSPSIKEVNATLSSNGLLPTINGKLTYKDIYDKTTMVTPNDQYIVQGKSKIEAYLSDYATGNKGATIKSYIFENSNQIITINNPNELPMTATYFDRPQKKTIMLKVIDSRQNQSEISIDVKFIEWSGITIDNFKIERKNQIEASCKLTINGKYPFPSEVYNNIERIRFQYKEKNATEYENYIYVDLAFITQNDGIYSVNEYAIGDFDVTKEYDVKIEVYDKLGFNTSNTIITNPESILWINKNNKTIAMGGKPKTNNPAFSFDAKGGFYENGVKVGAIDKNALKLEILKAQNPVGIILMKTNNTNPSTYLGFGTWVLWGSGRVPVGVDSSDSNFNTVEKTGGASSIKLTQGQMPAHVHWFNRNTSENGSHQHNINARANWSGESGYANTNDAWATGYRFYSDQPTDWGGSHIHNVQGDTDSRGGNEYHSNLQKYITCYMWKRTA